MKMSSNIMMMARRRASVAAADLMLASSTSTYRQTSIAAPLLSSFGNLLSNNNNAPKHQSHFFSSAASAAATTKKTKKTIIELPPNLKFDPRAKSSPFYGADVVESASSLRRKKKKEQQQQQQQQQLKKKVEGQEEVVVAAATTDDADASANDDVDNEEEEYIDIDDDEEEYDEEDEQRVLYDLSTKADVPRAIPLPQRLHVPIMDFKSGTEVGTFHLSEHTFGCDPVRVDILHRVVVWQRNKKRGKRNAGARTKTISEVSGSGRKVRNQKGGGVARAGHSRPAHWRGGAKAHGPKGKIQDYTTKLNKKVRRMGMRHALSQKLLEGNLIITNDMAATTHKTKVLDDMLKQFDVSGKYGVTALMVDDAKAEDDNKGSEDSETFVYGGVNVNLKVASGNLPKVKVMNQIACNVYDMLKYKKLFLSLDAVRALEARLEK
jgi:large subunit ribosomal protein L4